jgi:hypothetical protein
VLFLAALFAKGLTHDLFLEAGVFLVSVKIIVMAYRNSVALSNLNEKLDLILREIAKGGGKRGEMAAGSKDPVDGAG